LLDKVDYSIQYRRWHNGSLGELAATAKMYDRWIGQEIRKHPFNAKVLDYGCAFGSLVYYLRTYFNDVQGVDASEEQIEMAKRHDLPVEVLPITDFSNWCAKNAGTFDVIFLFDVLEHIPVLEQVNFMRALSGTLKQSGVMYIKVPNANSLLASRWRYIDWTHLASFTECSLDFVCLNSGLGEIEYFDDESSIKPRYWWIPRWNTRYFYLKALFRSIWKTYLKAELGAQADSIRIGYNLFARAKKL
jgi:hypothetical protein